MEVNKILSADFLDILFEGKNKEYGAYELRKTYQKRLTVALVSMVAICLLLFVGSLIASGGKKNNNAIVVADVQLEDVKKQEEKKPEPPPPPPPPKPEPPKVEIAKFTPPLIVKDEEVKPEDEIKENKDLEDVKIGDKNQEGIKDDGNIVVVEDKGTQQVEVKKDEEDYDKVFTKVEQPAEFPGGLKEWTKYLQRNLNSNRPSEEGAPAGNYTVRVQFIVDKDGNISNVSALNDPGYGTAEEAIRVIKKGPKWTPAVQNGRKVIYQAVQGITFQVTEE